MKILRLLNFLSQSDPTSPQEGDFWRNAARLKFHNGSTTEQVAHLSDLKIRRQYHFSYMSVATAQVSPFGKITTTNWDYPATPYPTTYNGSGIVNAQTDPYSVMSNCVAKRIRIIVGNASVQQGTVGSNPIIRVSLYKTSMLNARTLVGHFDIPLTVREGSIGTFTTVTNVYATGISPDQNFALAGGDAIGIEFTPQFTNNNWIDSAGRMIAVLETEE